MNKSLTHLAALSLIAHADEKFHPEEDAFLKTVAQRLNIDENIAEEVIKQPAKFNHDLPVQEIDRYAFLSDILNLIVADGDIADVEVEYCRRLCRKLGFEQQMVNDIIIKMKTHIQRGFDQNTLSKTIDSGLNRLTSKITKHDRNH